MSKDRIVYSNKIAYSTRASKTALNSALLIVIMAVFAFNSSSSYAQSVICADLTAGLPGSKTGPWSPSSPGYSNYFTFYTPDIYSYLVLHQIQTPPLNNWFGWIDHGFGIYIELDQSATRFDFHAAWGNAPYDVVGYNELGFEVASVSVVGNVGVSAQYTLFDNVNNELIKTIRFINPLGGDYSEGFLAFPCATIEY